MKIEDFIKDGTENSPVSHYINGQHQDIHCIQLYIYHETSKLILADSD